MAVGIARKDDRTIGICCRHGKKGGKIITYSDDVFVNNRNVARVGDTVLADCGDTGTIATGAETVLTNNKKTARLGDVTEGCYVATIITASEDTFTEDNGAGYDEPIPMTPMQQASLAAQAAAGPGRFYPLPPNGIPDDAGEVSDEIPHDPDQLTNPNKCVNSNGIGPYDLAKQYQTEGGWQANGNNPKILGLWKDIGKPQSSDKVHWCAAFTGAVLKRSGMSYKQTEAARGYLDYGTSVPGNNVQEKLQNARPGDVVVFSRQDPTNPNAGHVGFFESTSGNKVTIIGGNQGKYGDVTQSERGTDRILDIRRPKECQEPSPTPPPTPDPDP